MFNARHYERIKNSLDIVEPRIVVPSNVVDFVEKLERKHYSPDNALRVVNKFLQR